MSKDIIRTFFIALILTALSSSLIMVSSVFPSRGFFYHHLPVEMHSDINEYTVDNLGPAPNANDLSNDAKEMVKKLVSGERLRNVVVEGAIVGGVPREQRIRYEYIGIGLEGNSPDLYGNQGIDLDFKMNDGKVGNISSRRRVVSSSIEGRQREYLDSFMEWTINSTRAASIAMESIKADDFSYTLSATWDPIESYRYLWQIDITTPDFRHIIIRIDKDTGKVMEMRNR